MNDLYTMLGDIFNPANNPYFTSAPRPRPRTNDDNIEDAEIIEEIPNTK